VVSSQLFRASSCVSITAAVAVLVAIRTSGLKTFKFHENWINYNSIAEILKKETYLFDADLGGYGESQDKMRLFVKREEAVISRDNLLRAKHSPNPKKGKRKASEPL
jgi:hypothetical protein